MTYKVILSICGALVILSQAILWATNETSSPATSFWVLATWVLIALYWVWRSE